MKWNKCPTGPLIACVVQSWMRPPDSLQFERKPFIVCDPREWGVNVRSIIFYDRHVSLVATIIQYNPSYWWWASSELYSSPNERYTQESFVAIQTQWPPRPLSITRLPDFVYTSWTLLRVHSVLDNLPWLFTNILSVKERGRRNRQNKTRSLIPVTVSSPMSSLQTYWQRTSDCRKGGP